MAMLDGRWADAADYVDSPHFHIPVEPPAETPAAIHDGQAMNGTWSETNDVAEYPSNSLEGANAPEHHLDQEIAELISKHDFEPRDTEAVIAASRALVGNEEVVIQTYGADRVQKAERALWTANAAVTQPPYTDWVVAAKLRVLGYSADEIKQELAVLAEDAKIEPVSVHLDQMPKSQVARDKLKGRLNGDNFIRRGNRLVLEDVSAAVRHVGDLALAPVAELTADTVDVIMDGIKLEAAHVANEKEEEILAGAARWVLKHSPDYQWDGRQEAA